MIDATEDSEKSSEHLPTPTKVVRIIMDIGLSVALMSEKEKFEVSSSYSIGKHPNLPRPFFSCVFIQVKSIKVSFLA